jgi:hypothetical protein
MLDAILTRLQPPPTLPRFLRHDLETLHPYRLKQALHELYYVPLINYDGKDASPPTHPWARDRLDRKEKALSVHITPNTLTEAIVLPPEDSGEEHGPVRKDLLPHVEVCLAACPIDITDSHSRIGRLHLSAAKLFQQTLFLVTRAKLLNAAKCGYVYAARGRFD